MSQDYYTNEDYPIYAAQWIKKNLDLKTLRIFNEYNYGSYLVYQEIPVMIDSRADLYSPEFNTKTGKIEDGNDIFMDVQNVTTGDDDYRDVFEKYGITHVITYANSSLQAKLKKDKDYKKIYPNAFELEIDKKFVIYEKINQTEQDEEKPIE